MIIAVDTNIFLDILRPNPKFLETSLAIVERSATQGVLTICNIVYAELAANFDTQSALDRFLDATEVRVQPASTEACFLAGRQWLQYRKAGGTRARILPDFLIGAHAQLQASRLLSRDRGFYRSYFPKLRIVSS